MTEREMPWHHGLVSVLALIFYGLGAVQYVLVRIEAGFFTGSMNPEALALMQGLPTWLNVVWAICVWGGLVGAWLLRSGGRLAPALLFVAVVCFAILVVWTSLFTTPTVLGLYGFSGLYSLIGTGAIAALFWLYARWERSEKLLTN